MVVVTIIIVRVILKISCEMCDRDKPNIAKIKENSLIWLRETEDKNDVLFPCLKNFNVVNMINGFIIKINNSSDINGNQVLDIFENVICVPSVTKKITEKKSFSDLFFRQFLGYMERWLRLYLLKMHR